MAIASCAVVAVIVATADDRSPRRATAVPADTSRPIVIAALGASDATGEGTLDPERENWVAQLSELLPDDVEVRRFGLGGAWLSVAHASQVPGAAAIDPDIVIGWLIVNDLTQGETLDNYVATLDRVLADLSRPGRTILLANAPQLWHLPAFDSGAPEDNKELRREVERWNAAVDRIAGQHGATVIDLCQDPVASEDLCDDGFHPSASGHAKLAGTFYPHVMRAVARARSARLERAAD